MLKDNLLQLLNAYWDSPTGNSAKYLNNQSSEKDVAEIIEYIQAIIETAYAKEIINETQYVTCLKNIERLTAVLAVKKSFPEFKKLMLEITPEQLLHSTINYSDKDAEDLKKHIEQDDKELVEVLQANNPNSINFYYEQLNGNDEYFDRYIEKNVPINGSTEFCCYDNYLPLYKLIEKYISEKVVRIHTRQKPEKYIYVITFKYFPNYAKGNANALFNIVPKHILDDCKAGKALLVYNDLDGTTNFSNYNYEFSKQISALGINNSFFVLSGEWANTENNKQSFFSKIKQLFTAPYPKVKVYVADYFEEAMAYSKQRFHPHYDYNLKLAAVSEGVENLKHFVCLNRTVKDYRLYMSYFMYANNLLTKSVISQDKYTGQHDFMFGYNTNSALWNKIDTKTFETFKASLPWLIDADHQSGYDWDTVPLNAINQSFCWVVTETSFGNYLPTQTFRLTEKTYKPIAYFMPFIMVGNPFILRELKAKGYQTFSKWWNESYDEVIDPIKRMELITDVILTISKYSQAELLNIYKEMEPVLNHNYNVLIGTTSGNQIATAINSAYNNL